MKNNILGKKTTRCLDGDIVISIKCYMNFFEITIEFPDNLDSGKLKDENPNVFLALTVHQKLSSSFSISKQIKYRKHKDGNLKLEPIKVFFKYNHILKGTVTLMPEFYLTKKAYKEAQLQQECKSFSDIEIHDKFTRSSPSKFIPYVGAQCTKPYRG